MRISDWSSDVCSSDLHAPRIAAAAGDMAGPADDQRLADAAFIEARFPAAIGRRRARRVGADGGAVVRGENDQRVVEFARLPQPVDEPADLGIHCDEHREELVRSEEHTSELQSLMRNSYA